MYLKQLELENFKSFGKKMTIPFMEGFTAVTGPNGSGKSNISDAILFVLGPKSSKAIRAGKLTDLIYNGGNTKQAASYTKVSLVFDNADHLIPIDAAVVKLTRLVKLSESGDGYNSYFYVNDRKSSLGEFDALLSNARISAEGYNLVQQGDVTKIVEMSNVDRRCILDDISGISKFDEEIVKAEAERKAAEDNLDRIAIIMTELDKQIAQLEEERTSALKYLEAKDRLTLAKAQLAYKKKENVEEEIASVQRQMQESEKEIAALQARKLELAGLIKTAETKVADKEKEIEARGGEEFRELKEKMDAAKIETARAQEQSRRSQADATDLEEGLQERNEDAAALDKEIVGLTKRLKELESKHLEKLALLDKRRQELDEVSQKVSHSDNELGALDKRVTELDELVRKREEERHVLTLETERLQDKVERLTAELANQEEGRKTLEFELQDAEFKIKEMRSADKSSAGELKGTQEEYFRKKNLETKYSKEAAELEQAIRRLNREYSQLKAEQEAAESVAKGYNRAVRSLIEARDRREIKGIHGTIAELAEVDAQYEVALNVAAGSRMQSIVVDDDEVAAQAIQFLKRNGMGRATFLPLNKMLDGKPRGKALLAEKESVGLAIDLIHFQEKYRAAFWYVFGDTVVVDTLDKARRLMGGVRLVTLSGELIESSGAMVGGTVESSQLKFGASSKSKLDELAEELRRSTEHAEKLDEELKQLRADLVALEASLREMNGSGGANSVKLEALEARKKELKTRMAQEEGETRKLTVESAEAQAGIAKLQAQIEAAGKGLGSLKAERDGGKKRILDIAPKDLSAKLKALQAELVSLSTETSALKSDKETTGAQLTLQNGRKDEIAADLKDTTDRIAKLRQEAKEATEKETKLSVELAGLKRIEESMGAKMKAVRDERDALFKQKTKLESERDKVQTKCETSADFGVTLKTKLALSQEGLKALLVELETYNKVPVKPPLPAMDELIGTINECERALDRMGNVNLKAIDDYQQKGSRRDELRAETARLQEQRKDLLKLMAELNDKKKVALSRVFVAVNDNFKQIYAELSGGGEAELLLENADSPFEGGLVIKAKPRMGKTMRLEALSGGEKSLTALSFIFAIQQFQPSPFYLLDEVDMFLDAVNADMVAHRVQKCSKTAQFCMISLRKVTLCKADHAIGVTKGEGGISHVIMKANLGDIKDLQDELHISEEKAEAGA
jgi:chromosome segregation protein